MILVILYTGAGLYMLLMFFGLIHREYMKTMNRNRRIGLLILALGFLILGVTYSSYYFGDHEKEGRHPTGQMPSGADTLPSPPSAPSGSVSPSGSSSP